MDYLKSGPNVGHILPVDKATYLKYYIGLFEAFNSVVNLIQGIFLAGTVVAQWLMCCATNRKVAGSIPDGVMEFFIDIILPIALWPWG